MEQRTKQLLPQPLTKTDYLATALLIAGGFVLGFDALLQRDVLQSVLSAAPVVSNGLKLLIGLAAVYVSASLFLRRRNQA